MNNSSAIEANVIDGLSHIKWCVSSQCILLFYVLFDISATLHVCNEKKHFND